MPSAVDRHPEGSLSERKHSLSRRARAASKCLAAALGALPPLALAADFSWESGDFIAGVTAPSPLLPGDTLTILGGGTKRFLGGSFTNAGHVLWLADAVQGGNGAQVFNPGLWESFSDTNSLSGFGAAPTFTNTGTLRKSAGSGATTIGNWIFVNNAGILDAAVGKIAFNGGVTTFNANSKFQGAGSVSIEADASFSGSFLSDNLVLASGVFTGSSARLAGGVAAAAGSVAWMAGDIRGTWEFAAGSSVAVSGAGTKRQAGGEVVNFGAVIWNSSAAFQGGESASFVNHGLFEAQASTTLSTYSPFVRNTFTNASAGTVRATNGATLTVGSTALVGQGGTFDAATGSSIAYGGGFAQFENGTRFTGAGTHVFSNDARFAGTITTANVTFAGGTQTGGSGASGSIALLQGPLAWTGGNLQGNWEFAAGSVVEASGPGTKRQTGGTIVNNGTVLWDSAVPLQGGNGAVFTNNGLFEARTSTQLAYLGAGARSGFTNAASGVVRASNGATLAINDVSLISNAGVFDATAGSALIYAGGMAQFNPGTRFTGAGTHTVTSDARFVGSIQAANLAFAAGGTRTGGNGPSTGSRASVEGPLAWTGGDLQGHWEIPAGSTWTASGDAAKRQMGGTLVNNGALEWTAAADFQQGGGSAFSNNGLFDISTDADFTHATGAPASFVNSGRLVKSAGSGETSLTRVDFSNPGTIDVRSGTIVLPASFDNAGLLTGTGTYSYSGFLDNEGHIAPGASPGTLTLDGHFRQSETGVLDIEVNSARLHDLLIVDGTVQLGGTLALHCFADCFVGAGETITILMASGPLLSAFDTVTLKGFGGGSFVAPRYDGGQVSLLVTGALVPVPEPEVYAMMLTGLGLVAWAIRRRQRRVRRV